jgi:hypothetical protein
MNVRYLLFSLILLLKDLSDHHPQAFSPGQLSTHQTILRCEVPLYWVDRRCSLDRGVVVAGLLGRLIDTFVVAELRSHVAADAARPQLFHVRTEGGRREIDALLEYDGGKVFGIEIKATATPRASDARHLMWLADELGDRFAGGLVFHSGPGIIEFERRIRAMPICALPHPDRRRRHADDMRVGRAGEKPLTLRGPVHGFPRVHPRT